MAVFSHITCCFNLSENPDDIVQYVNDLVKQNSAQLTLIHVSPSTETLPKSRISTETEALIEKSRKTNQENFVAYVKEHFADCEPNVVFAEGNTDTEVLSIIDQYCSDLVIIGSTSTKGLFGRWFNRPSEKIIGKTRVPVLVIPNDLSLECTPDF